MKSKLKECRDEYISSKVSYYSFEDIENITREIDNFINYCNADVKGIEGLLKCKHDYISALKDDDKQLERSKIIDLFLLYFEKQYLPRKNNPIVKVRVKNGKDTLEFDSLNYGEIIDMLLNIEKSYNEHSNFKIIHGLIGMLISLSYHLKKVNKRNINVAQAKEYFRKQSPENILTLFQNIINIERKEFVIINEINNK